MAKAGAGEVEDLPKAIVRRVVKEKLSELCTDGGGDMNVHKEALQAFAESGRLFIHYLSATANDVCKESKRQTINAEDIFKALEEIEFSEFIKPLKASLNGFRRKNAGKRASAAKAKESNKKKKKEEEQSAQNEDENEENNEEEENDEEDEGEEANEEEQEEDETPDEE